MLLIVGACEELVQTCMNSELNTYLWPKIVEIYSKNIPDVILISEPKTDGNAMSTGQLAKVRVL